MKIRLVAGLFTSLSVLFLSLSQPVSAQIVPQPWVSVGEKDGDVSTAVGAKAFGLGVELGNIDGATGVDVLKFINLPVVSPYAGLGLYSDDKGVAVSGGVQVNASDNLFVGVGYNTVRGVNGQVGFKF